MIPMLSNYVARPTGGLEIITQGVDQCLRVARPTGGLETSLSLSAG